MDSSTSRLSVEQQKEYMHDEYNIAFPSNLTDAQLNALTEVLYRNRHAFIDSPGKIGFNASVPHVIKIKENAVPITQ